jgi:DNA-binding response OmpR family regulator
VITAEIATILTGFEVDVARNFKQALAQLDRHACDAAVLDVALGNDSRSLANSSSAAHRSWSCQTTPTRSFPKSSARHRWHH